MHGRWEYSCIRSHTVVIIVRVIKKTGVVLVGEAEGNNRAQLLSVHAGFELPRQSKVAQVGP